MEWYVESQSRPRTMQGFSRTRSSSSMSSGDCPSNVVTANIAPASFGCAELLLYHFLTKQKRLTLPMTSVMKSVRRTGIALVSLIRFFEWVMPRRLAEVTCEGASCGTGSRTCGPCRCTRSASAPCPCPCASCRSTSHSLRYRPCSGRPDRACQRGRTSESPAISEKSDGWTDGQGCGICTARMA